LTWDLGLCARNSNLNRGYWCVANAGQCLISYNTLPRVCFRCRNDCSGGSMKMNYTRLTADILDCCTCVHIIYTARVVMCISTVYVAVGSPSVCFPSLDSSSGAAGLLLSSERVKHRPIDRQQTPALISNGAQQQMRAVSCGQPRDEAEHRFVYGSCYVIGANCDHPENLRCNEYCDECVYLSGCMSVFPRAYPQIKCPISSSFVHILYGRGSIGSLVAMLRYAYSRFHG